MTEVTNSRPTKEDSQIWRRRKCLHCGAVFTTHEIIDLSHLVVTKKSGKREKFSRIKLYSGIYGATIGYKIPRRELLVERVTREVERDILYLKQKKITSTEIAEIVLRRLRKANVAVFLKFLVYCKNITSEIQITKELEKN